MPKMGEGRGLIYAFLRDPLKLTNPLREASGFTQGRVEPLWPNYLVVITS